MNDDLRRLIRTIPDHPKPGILFRDVTTLFGDARGLEAGLERLQIVLQDGGVVGHGSPALEAIDTGEIEVLGDEDRHLRALGLA